MRTRQSGPRGEDAASMEVEPQLTQVATAATTAAPSDISVTFSQAGPLGIHLGWRNDRIHLLARHGYPNGIKPGTQAEQHPQLRAGLVVTSVNGTSTVGMALRQILELSKASGRPLVMTFAAAAAPAHRFFHHLAPWLIKLLRALQYRIR